VRGMDDIDKKILGIIQSEFPLSPRPYQDLSDLLGFSEEEILGRVKNLKKDGIIRRIGGSFDSHLLGFTTSKGARVQYMVHPCGERPARDGSINR